MTTFSTEMLAFVITTHLATLCNNQTLRYSLRVNATLVRLNRCLVVLRLVQERFAYLGTVTVKVKCSAVFYDRSYLIAVGFRSIQQIDAGIGSRPL